jgi:hypothetical protein
MHRPHGDALDYVQFLIAAPRPCTGTEAARCAPPSESAPAHEACTRLRPRQPPETAARWQAVRPLVRRRAGVLVLDDTTRDTPDMPPRGRVPSPWSGKHPRVVKGITRRTRLWTDGPRRLPCACRVEDQPTGGQTQHAPCRTMLEAAQARGLAPR